MSEWRNNRIEELNNQLNSADSKIAEYRSELNKLESVRLQIIGALTVLDEESKAEASKSEVTDDSCANDESVQAAPVAEPETAHDVKPKPD